ncbi:hypothetical protein F993_02133 [Acinetobacter proteolyticus]|uniref:Uncharacterized protein n=1 Tax=Acinetobacter proteolyticus TaxID=1776741 RepID=A0A2N0WFX0_9GAMM|nr:hypothetical protein [Acinetobacter proteolyticus]ENU23264.1 hypothetical protein F993_02133 [Acinetobacter proteolyticus]PKF33947.1 hypothetical protein CW311_08855 [Acinetobacter proteolyticus]WEI17430.1 hypothetical protein PY247_13175 [Acinetobacter proteolyticus]
MPHKPLLTLIFTFSALTESTFLYANQFIQTDSNSHYPSTISKNMKQIYQGEHGIWFLSKHRGRKGGCAVSYNSGLSQLTLFGPSEKNTGALVFTGPHIPITTSNQQLAIVIRTDHSVMPTEAILLPSQKKGMLLVPVSMVQTASNMDDVGAMEILLKGKTIYASSISGGFRARDALMSCIKS